MATSVYLDIFMGNRAEHARLLADYDSTRALLSKNASIYGLPSDPADLSEEQQDILRDIDKSLELQFTSPRPLSIGRLKFRLDDSPGLSKTTANFTALCTGEKGACKNAPNKRLHFLECPMHRIVKGFIAQGGDVTRGDGSGGESIYGGKFNDEKPGLKVKASFGSLGMANSGKNSNTSQFFVVLTDEPDKLAKISGKYVIFGQLEESAEAREVMRRVDEVGGKSEGKTSVPVWIGGCGRC